MAAGESWPTKQNPEELGGATPDPSSYYQEWADWVNQTARDAGLSDDCFVTPGMLVELEIGLAIDKIEDES